MPARQFIYRDWAPHYDQYARLITRHRDTLTMKHLFSELDYDHPAWLLACGVQFHSRSTLVPSRTQMRMVGITCRSLMMKSASPTICVPFANNLLLWHARSSKDPLHISESRNILADLAELSSLKSQLSWLKWALNRR